jgi:3-oxoacyl-[acyl-carrier protein] reductase
MHCSEWCKTGCEMDLQLKDKVAIIGGASQGIGYGIARALAGEGAKVAMIARREPALLQAAYRIHRETGSQVLPIAADSRRAADLADVLARVLDVYGGIDIVVNNGGGPPIGEAVSFDDADWQKALEQNLMYVVRMARGAVPHMQARGGGAIVNIAGVSALQPIEKFGLAVASWNAMIGFSKTFSIEAAPFGIRMNTICPGYIETGRLDKVFAASGQDPDVMRDKLRSGVPLGRIGTVEDIASLATLLVSPRGSYITGTTIQVDGGLLRAVR